MLLLFAPSALAANATEVYVNNVKLDAGNPYWKNGNAAASASDWNAYFDANSATLTLRDATINTMHSVDYFRALVYGNGDITIKPEGTNTLQYTAGSGTENIVGILSDGTLTLAGDGRLQAQITKTGSGTISATRSELDTTIQSGVLDIQLEHDHTIYGMYMHHGDLVITGGQTSITCSALYTFGVNFADGEMRMTGGQLYISVEGDDRAYGLYSPYTVTLENATVRITAQGGTSWGYGVRLEEDTLTVTGGDVTLAGNTNAMRFDLHGSETRAGLYPIGRVHLRIGKLQRR